MAEIRKEYLNKLVPYLRKSKMKYNINNRYILNQSLKLKKIKEIKDEKLCNNILENKANKIDKKFFFKNIILKNYIIFFILIDLFIKILTSNKPLLFVLNYSTIKLKIIGKGHKYFRFKFFN